jgi:hypothetical protein
MSIFTQLHPLYHGNMLIPKTHACLSSFNLAALVSDDLTKGTLVR